MRRARIVWCGKTGRSSAATPERVQRLCSCSCSCFHIYEVRPTHDPLHLAMHTTCSRRYAFPSVPWAWQHIRMCCSSMQPAATTAYPHSFRSDVRTHDSRQHNSRRSSTRHALSQRRCPYSGTPVETFVGAIEAYCTRDASRYDVTSPHASISPAFVAGAGHGLALVHGLETVEMVTRMRSRRECPTSLHTMLHRTRALIGNSRTQQA